MKTTLKTLALALLLGAPAVGDEALIKQGHGVYKQFCLKCHGADMINSGASSYDLRKFPVDQFERFETAVMKGKGNMPAWGDILYPEELDQVWAYVASRAGTEPLPPKKTEASAAQKSYQTVNKNTLTACLPSNGGAMSGRRSTGGVGLDYEMAAAAAKHLGLTLEVVWFEGELEEESNPVRETYAMLSYPLCDIVPGHLLYDGTFGPREGQRAGLPRWQHMPTTLPKGFAVDLLPVNVSLPYARIEMGVVMHKDVKHKKINVLSDMAGLVVGIQEDTLAGAITLTQGGAEVKEMGVHDNPGPGFLWRMEQGKFEAALVSVPEYDFHLRQNMITELVLTDYRHPLGFNIGFAILSAQNEMAGALNGMIKEMLSNGEIEALAAKTKLHYAAPQEPYIQRRITLQDMHLKR